jgi:hypothetical protein
MATIKPDAVADPRPGSRGYFKFYWCYGEGRKRWVGLPHPFTALKTALRGKVPASYINRVVAAWFEEVYGYPPSARQGVNPVGKG